MRTGISLCSDHLSFSTCLHLVSECNCPRHLDPLFDTFKRWDAMRKTAFARRMIERDCGGAIPRYYSIRGRLRPRKDWSGSIYPDQV